MKRIIVIICCLLIITGCNQKTSTEQNEYNNIITSLESSDEITDSMPFNVVLETEVVVDEIRYTIAVNDVKEKITDLKAVAYHDYPTNDIFPSIGIFDEPINLEPNGSSKGIVLVGYIPYTKEEITYKLYISYKVADKLYEGYWNSTK